MCAFWLTAMDWAFSKYSIALFESFISLRTSPKWKRQRTTAIAVKTNGIIFCNSPTELINKVHGVAILTSTVCAIPVIHNNHGLHRRHFADP